MPSPTVGIILPTMSERDEPLPDVVAAARHAEDLGFESVWVIDQLVAGTGVPFVDSTVALSAAAAATRTVQLGYGVMILPLHPTVWAAKQVASLQLVSGGRAILGVGAGGDRHDLSWAATGVPRRERGRRTDAALAVLPDLIAGREVDVDGTSVRLAPGVTVPPIVVGGMADAALRRAATYGDSWYTLPLPPEQLARPAARLAELAAEVGRPVPGISVSVMAAIDGDPALPDDAGLVRRLTDPDGTFGLPADAVPETVVTGPPAALAERIAAFGELGVERVVLSLAGGDWHRQAELIVEAAALVA
jgi:alkanesulfonate monooxygenase SsuD/methylene tetrahydromethanopterin reductase-like flavin-dependent oxidoreductase (luciferase family)